MGRDFETGRRRVRVVSAEVRQEGGYLLTQRAAKAVLPDLWEFPGGRVHDGETDEQALCAALSRRLGVTAIVGEHLMEVVHDAPEHEITLVVYRCVLQGAPRAVTVQDVAWVLPEHFSSYAFPDADAATVARLIEDLDAEDAE